MLSQLLKIKTLGEAKLRREIARLEEHERETLCRQADLRSRRASEMDTWRRLSATHGCYDRTRLLTLKVELAKCSEAIRLLNEEDELLLDDLEEGVQRRAEQQRLLLDNLRSQEKLKCIMEEHESCREE